MSFFDNIENYTSITPIGGSWRYCRIDSRDLIAARNEAEDLLAEDDEKLTEVQAKADELAKSGAVAAGDELEIIAPEYDLLTDDERADLTAIIEEVDELDGCCADWAYGASFIPEYEWEEYAEEFADEIGAIDRNASWPVNCIDWERAAAELAIDYTTVEIDGESYYVR